MSCTQTAVLKSIEKDTLFKGAKFTVNTKDEFNVLTPVNLIGSQIEMLFKLNDSVSIKFSFKTSDNTITLSNAEVGVFNIMPRNMNYSVGVYNADIIQITPANERIFRGNVTIKIC